MVVNWVQPDRKAHWYLWPRMISNVLARRRSRPIMHWYLRPRMISGALSQASAERTFDVCREGHMSYCLQWG